MVRYGGQNFRTVDFGWSACADEIECVVKSCWGINDLF